MCCVRPHSPTAEAADLKSVQCRFESDWGHQCARLEPWPDGSRAKVQALFVFSTGVRDSDHRVARTAVDLPRGLALAGSLRRRGHLDRRMDADRAVAGTYSHRTGLGSGTRGHWRSLTGEGEQCAASCRSKPGSVRRLREPQLR